MEWRWTETREDIRPSGRADQQLTGTVYIVDEERTNNVMPKRLGTYPVVKN